MCMSEVIRYNKTVNEEKIAGKVFERIRRDWEEKS